MELTLLEITDLVGGELHGDPAQVIRGVCALEARGEVARDHLSFVHAKADMSSVRGSEVTALVVDHVAAAASRQCIVVADPYVAFACIAARFHPLPRARETRIDATAVVATGAELADPVQVGPHAVIEAGARVGPGTIVMAGVVVGQRAVVGRDCILYPRTVLYEGVVLGDRVRIHAGAVIGADGFGNARDGGRWVRIPQTGNVVLGDDVTVGACTTIDRATFGSTRVGRGTKIDNLVMIAHNCDIGEDCALAGQVGMAGTTRVGDRVQMAGQVGLAGHIEVTDDVVLGAKAGVMASIDEAGFYVGQPAIPARAHLKLLAGQKQVAEMRQRIAELEKRVEELAAGHPQ